jgi:WD40 repeat protein
VALSAGGNYLLSGCRDQTVKLWDVTTGRALRTFKGHTNWVTAACFAPNGKLGVSVSDDLTVRVWDLTSGKEVERLDLGECGDCGRCATFAADGRSVLVGTINRVVLRVALTARTK